MNVEKLNPEDLVLHLNKTAENFDISKYEDFLYELCGDWEFQKESIRKTIRYFISNQYNNSKELLLENYQHNGKLKLAYSEKELENTLPFPNKLAGTIDLATGTGKSWVMYAVSRILLAEGIVDQVLILCPSKTIKQGLYKKFTDFTSNNIINESLPKGSVILIPGIKHSDETIEKGDICIDNVHKTYDHVSSSISDSLQNKGQRTLLINDEAHHMLNPKDSDKETALEWNKFVNDSKYNFKYVLNLSGTPYKGNNYFNDVIYRYSIRDAINDKFVKNIDYLSKDELDKDDWSNRWRAILKNHEESKRKYNRCKKHITIIVTNKINTCNEITEELKQFLKDNTNITPELIDKKVIPVTSSPQHDQFRDLLDTVDEEHNPVEWIVSVSMLTEGWDVKNVFQIVPHEQRAFDSKLLISQVLGRGLRMPKEYFGTEIQPKVTVYNHPAWGSKIDNLVHEIAEINRTITSKVDPKSKYNFELEKISIKKEIINTKKVEQKDKKITLPKQLGFISDNKKKVQEFTNVKTHRLTIRETEVEYNKYSVSEAVNEIFTMLYVFDMNKQTEISEKISKEYIESLIKKELREIGEENVSEQNLQRAKQSFGVSFRSAVGFTEIKELYQEVEIINTNTMQDSFISESAFKNSGTLVTCDEYFESLPSDEAELIEDLLKESNINQTTLSEDDDSYYVRGKIIKDLSLDQYKSPINLTLLNYTPEREFVELFINEYSSYVDSWIKSKDKGFYSIPYIHRPGTHSLQKDFNPDFFFKKNKKIIVVEIKTDNDLSVKNKDKLDGAMEYFNKLNEKLKNQKYEFYFLGPSDYRQFFENVIKKDLKFKGKLQSDLESKSREYFK